MKRGGPLRRLSPLRPKRKPAGVASGIKPENRMLVLLRDKGHCLRCGLWLANVPSSVHHRLPRGRGGDDRLSGLVHLCGSGTTGCHGTVHSDVAQAYDDGWLVRTGADPSGVPVLTYRGWVALDDNGQAAPINVRREM